MTTKTMQVTVKATAEIEEIWTVKVPADWDGDPEELLELLGKGKNFEFISDRVVGDERNREVIGIEAISTEAEE
ncbi:hypothetical protein [Nocardia terpenica]|uniref:hypothetical protein n=1 Tax=Nocardia terpenica TaxID=455432 RepID=UPI0012E72763|nr:hypothetical protein [Nocardia terpenica]NQE86605.1 hypothetical protein [Nocardia terpenica]